MPGGGRHISLHEGLTALLSMTTYWMPTVCQWKEMGSLHRHRKVGLGECPKVQHKVSLGSIGTWGEGLVVGDKN